MLPLLLLPPGVLAGEGGLALGDGGGELGARVGEAEVLRDDEVDAVGGDPAAGGASRHPFLAAETLWACGDWQ